MSDFRIHLIPVFLDLMHTLNVSRTAERMRLSQPAVSRQLKSLEENLRVSLFVRQSRGLRPTAAAKTLARKLSFPIESIQDSLNAIKDDAVELQGTIIAGCLGEVGQKIFGPLLFDFASKNKGISIDLRFLPESEIAKQLSEGGIGIGVATRELSGDSIRLHRWLQETIVVLTSKNNSCQLEDCLAPRFVCYRPQDSLLLAYLKKHPLKHSKLDIVVSVNSHSSMIDALTKIDCYAVMPLHSATSALLQKRLRIASKNHLKSEVMLAMPAHDFQERRYSEVLKYLKKNVRDIEDIESKLLLQD